MSEDASIVAGAKRLASKQAEVLNRIEVIRRQRYNQWAARRIELALDFYNANVSRFNPFNDNANLIDSLVMNLGEVDPIILEPAVLELFDYVIDRIWNSNRPEFVEVNRHQCPTDNILDRSTRGRLDGVITSTSSTTSTTRLVRRKTPNG